jgi:putative membrane protein
MHTGKGYTVTEFLVWTRGKIYKLAIIGLVPVVLYEALGLKWMTVPWAIVGLLGTATAFTVGFKNTQTYHRTAEGQKIWTAIIGASRYWSVISRDFFTNPTKTQELLYRHLAWLTVLRYHLRSRRVWESIHHKHNAEYQQYYVVPEHEAALETELAKYLAEPELSVLLATPNKAAHLLARQSQAVRELYQQQDIVVLQMVEMERTLKDFYSQQAQSEQLKESPYPRQYAIINTLFVWLFCLLLPFGMLRDFDRLNELVSGPFKGHMVWLVVPFSLLISWMYTALEQVGESTENPFEGSANDVPISQIARSLEIEFRQLLGEQNLPPELQPQHDIIL